MTETTMPTHWYVIVSGWIKAYADAFATMQDPSFERLETEGEWLAKLTSSSFARLSDYEEVLNDAGKWIHLIMGAMHINQGPGPLKIVNVVGVFDDGTTRKFPPYGRMRKIRSGMPTITLKEEATPRATFEQSVVLFAHRSKNPLITDALRFLAISPDWFGLYKVIEVVKSDLNKVAGNRAGFKHIEDSGWATKAEIDAFKATAEHHRHWNSPAPRTSMDLLDARQLVGRVVRQWIVAVSRRPIAPAAAQEPPERHTP